MNSSDWEEYKIEDLVEVIFSGGTPNTKIDEYWNGSLPWLSSGETKNRYIDGTEKTITESGAQNSSTRLALSGDVVMASAGQGYTRGQVSFLNIDTFINQSVIAIRANEKVLDKKFLFYNLSNRYEELRAISDSNSIRGSITTKMVKSMTIDIPSLDTQKSIVNILSSIDDKIENNKRINHHLEQIGTIIWQERFSNKVPNGVLGDIAVISSGKRPPVKVTEPTDDEKIPILGASSIMGYTNQALYHKKILVTGRVGTHGIIQRYQRSCWPSDNTLVLQSDFYEYVHQVLKHTDFTTMNRGSTQPLITQTDLKKSKIYIPSTNELSDFEMIVGTYMKQYEQNNVENEILFALRDTLLPKLLSGEISVNQAAK